MRLLRKLAGFRDDQRGIGLAETLVAVAILGTAGVSFGVALATGSLTVNEQATETTAQRLVQSQLEYTKSYAYDPGVATYPLIAVPAGYELTVAVSAVPGADTDIQTITVTASRDGEAVLTIDDYKVNR